MSELSLCRVLETGCADRVFTLCVQIAKQQKEEANDQPFTFSNNDLPLYNVTE